MPRESHYESSVASFNFLSTPTPPHWRTPQIGAIAAAVSCWTIDPAERLLLSMPTGSGKSGVATALPYLARAHRVLVVVPNKEVRDQIASAFQTEDVLRAIGAVSGGAHPIVEKVQGRSIDWLRLESCDVVVALPNSISPAHFVEGNEPDPTFFDLVIVDEAHHAPAATWRAILDYYPAARAVLLTATPRRSDGKALPGSHAFHYPLRRAMADGIYNVIEPRVLDMDLASTADSRDRQIATEVCAAANEPEHSTSSILVRAASVARAGRLQALYAEFGIEALVLTSKVPTEDRSRIIADWRAGNLRAVITVDMLVEGFDLPSLRIVGYHDKHKSELTTIQFIGRLARSSSDYPQPSVLVTVRDQDVYPSLQGALRELYNEDADWAELLPGFIDDAVRDRQLDLEYLDSFPASPTSISLAALSPLARATIYEVPTGVEYQPAFVESGVPAELAIGAIFASQTVAYSGLNSHASQLIVLTSRLETPRWYVNDDGLTRPVFDLHVISWHKSANTTKPDLLFVNTHDDGMIGNLLQVVDPDGALRRSDPKSLQDAFDSLERFSVSSVGVRNTFAGTPGTPSYAMFAGSGVDRGLREADTSNRALGHAMAQVAPSEGGSINAGMASSKSKYWETRYLGLRAYESFSVELAGRYWFPRTTVSGPLLPNVAKAIRTDAFPPSAPIAAEFNPSLLGRGWTLSDGRALENLDLQVDPTESTTASTLWLQIVDSRDPETLIWRGHQTIDGQFLTTSEALYASRGVGQQTGLGDLLTIAPPTVYFLDGHTVFGGVTYLPVTTENVMPDSIEYRTWDWSDVDITHEIRRAGSSDSIDERIEATLTSEIAAPGTSRWVLRNDGSGEIADYLVIEMPPSRRPRLELWHAKAAAGANPSARVDDMQVVTQQAAKSRRHITDRDFWNRVGRRLSGGEAPQLDILVGDRGDLLALCGLDATRLDESIAARPPTLQALIAVVQPGLSFDSLRAGLDANTISAGQVREFLTFLANSVQGLAEIGVIGSP
jgi:superfamily II DNA or RNA helicase